MGGATIIYKSKGIKKVLTKTKEGTVWVEEKLKPEPEPALKTKRKPEPELKTERKPEPVQKPRKRAAVSPLVGPERLRIADVLELLKVSRSTFYARLATGRYPPADGKDGSIPFWRASTIRTFLES